MELEGKVVDMIQALRTKGQERIADLLSRCRFRVMDDGRLEVAGSRDFCDLMKTPDASFVTTKIAEYLGFENEQTKVIYLPSAFAQDLPKRS